MRRARGAPARVANNFGGRTGVATDSATKRIDLDNQSAALLVGENDQHLRALEQLLDCEITLHGNQLTLDGTSEEVERGRELVDELLGLLRAGQGLDSTTLNLAASLSTGNQGWGKDLRKIMGDVILEHRGRRIRPKTVNQKIYVDAIRSNTITFGIGPAGTGRRIWPWPWLQTLSSLATWRASS